MGSLFDSIDEMFQSSKPEKEPENYGEFKDRLFKDIRAEFPGLSGTPNTEENTEQNNGDKGKKKPDEKPKETHAFFKNIFGKNE